MKALAVLAAACLVACGGGGETSGNPCDITIQLEGDSISIGAGAMDPKNRPGDLLAEAFKGTGVQILVTGVSGTTSTNRMLGQYGYTPFPQGVVGDIYITQFGVNDAQIISATEYRSNLRRLAAVPGAILQTPTPIKPMDVAPFAQIVREVAAEVRIPLIDAYSHMVSLPRWPDYLHDDVHPNDAMHRLLVQDAMLPVLKAQLAKRGCS